MKNNYQAKVTRHQKSRKEKTPAKKSATASIAQRYMELRRLRERIFEAEFGRSPR